MPPWCRPEAAVGHYYSRLQSLLVVLPRLKQKELLLLLSALAVFGWELMDQEQGK